ncbi:chromosome segregation protein SMC [Enterococcus sp. AZ103]|uniref:chromosome segregation protein SMC n=1 Tax=Enterococcus sp. AZ103 TaxID=2774628 RepID=UPI003F26C4D4
MHLKRIEIAGFKSFADRTKIEFEPGVTAVIGPNGSGKSNITEAIRWVLGEQSAKSLRGGKMPDIIFAGSETRQQLNIAEVTVILDNSDHYLPLDFSEVSVTRRYRRTGESDFFINKKACRLRDIQELFMDSGLGKESFSIISQGKVEAIFASKPEDRRGIFEEAAGVLKYKQRKKKAEQKLFETEDNLNRVEDIVYELEEQLTPLAAQSEAAKEFLVLKEQLQNKDVSLTVARILTSKETWEETKTDFEGLSAEIEQKNTLIQSTEKQLGELRQNRGVLDQQLEQGQQQLLHLTESLKQTEGQKELLLERSKNAKKSSSEYQASLAQTNSKIEETQNHIQQLETEQTEKLVERNQLVEAIKMKTAESAKYQKSTKELIEDLRGNYVELMQEQANVSNDLKYLERQYQQETAKNQQSATRFENLKQELAELKEQQANALEKSGQMEVLLKTQQTDYKELLMRKNQLETNIKQEQNTMYDLMSQVQQAKARQKSMQEIKENYNGFYQGVRSVLQHRKDLSGIVGAVAELIEVPDQYTLAIETALGAAAQHIVVENEHDARNGITYLKEHRLGRATFLPLTTIKARSLAVNHKSKGENLPGFIGTASSLVKFDDRVSNIVENLLGGIVIAEDLTSANQIARALNFQVRVVSLTGDVMNAGGSMTGGANKQGRNNHLFSQGHELEKLTQQAEMIQQKLQVKEKNVADLQQQLADLNQALENLRNQGEETRLAFQEAQNLAESLTNDFTRLEKEQSLFAYEAKELETFLADYEKQKKELTAKQIDLKAQQTSVDQEIKQLNEESDLLEEKRQTLASELSQLQANQAVLAEQSNHLMSQKNQLNQSLMELQTEQQRLENQIAALSDASLNHEETDESLAQRLAEFTEKKSALETDLADWKTKRQAIQLQVDQLDEALTTNNRLQKQLLAQQSQVDVQKNRLELQLDNELAYLQEEYNLTFEAAENQADQIENLAEAQQTVTQLKRKIEQLGPVNLNAIEQYEQVSERYDFLTTQRDDLLSAKEQLFETMDEMDDEVKKRFYQTFKGIRDKFQVVFPNMFGGGKAELILTDPDDLLNTGIEIEAQPPGKKLQNLSLLSGGERALTAIALLFSIIQVRPVPFCVLDEVEAALDEANVARFGRYLRNFQNDTQFIVVTHRKGTMEAADVLYGVTMQESGVSKIISVRLEEANEGGNFTSKKEEAK